MPNLKSSILASDGLRAGGFVRPAAEKFVGAWLACFLVMTRGDFLAAFSLEHARLASVCGIVGAAVSVALLAQMDRTTNSVARQATISAFATFIGDVFAHPSHFPPQWAEPLVTAVVSAGIAIAVWHAKRWAKSLWVEWTRPAFVQPQHDLSPIEIDAIEECLYNYNRRAIARNDGRGLGFTAGYGGAIRPELAQAICDRMAQ